MGKKMEHSKRGKRVIACVIFAILLLLLCVAVLLVLKKININQYLVAGYPVRGVDVSHYQGEIDWQQFKEQGIDFAFIKATEGSSFVDEKYEENWVNAREAGLYVGAYHFYSFDSPAASQAEHFISIAGDLRGALPPVVDIEYYGDKRENPPKKEQVVSGLQELLDALEKEYGVKPVIYTTYTVYNKYIRNGFQEYPLWIRNVYYPPVDIGREWTFWQYSDKGKLRGTAGEEKYVDLNVFGKDREELERMLIPWKAKAGLPVLRGSKAVLRKSG
ncbi:MAG: glycoside hydrolase family 25 protein [Acetatifactor sp.]|nr:glycoside hydrolase family 25 protein [Acetatifactor sp.]